MGRNSNTTSYKQKKDKSTSSTKEKAEEEVANVEAVNGGEDEGQLFYVEKIIDHKVDVDDNNKMKYLVRWQGYSADDDTWEPEENFVDKAVLNRYIKSIGGRQALAPKNDENSSNTKRKREETQAEKKETEEPVNGKKKKSSKVIVAEKDFPATLLNSPNWDPQLVSVKSIDNNFKVEGKESTVDEYRAVLVWKEGVLPQGTESEHTLGRVREKAKDTLLAYLLRHIRFRN